MAKKRIHQELVGFRSRARLVVLLAVAGQASFWRLLETAQDWVGTTDASEASGTRMAVPVGSDLELRSSTCVRMSPAGGDILLSHDLMHEWRHLRLGVPNDVSVADCFSFRSVLIV